MRRGPARVEAGPSLHRPSEEDVADVRRLLADARTARDSLRIPGPRDEVIEGTEAFGVFDERGERVEKWERVYRYSARWPSLELEVYELPDGRFRCGFGGKCLDGGG